MPTVVACPDRRPPVGAGRRLAQDAQGGRFSIRQLARAHPQAFLPDLARSLGAHGSILLALARPAEAAAAFAEGMRLLLPFARNLPQAFAELLQALCEGYLCACRAAGQPPEETLVREATETLNGKSIR